MKKINKGFTLIELSVAGAVMIILGIAILGLQKVLQDTELLGFVNYTNIEDTNSSVTPMAREMRTMRSGQNGAYSFVYGDSDEISFYSDIDFDGASELIRYYLEENTLYKSTIEPVGFPATYPPANAVIKPLTENVQNTGNPIFLYFNEDWPTDITNNPLPVPVDIAEVRLVRISLDINVNPENAERSTYSLSTNVNLRMLKDNL